MMGAHTNASWPKVLTIAGSDSGGGAGIQADLKTFQELEVFGMSAITAITAQNSLGVQSVYPLPVSIVADQIDAVLSDIGADVVKTGMLLSAEIVGCTVEAVKRHRIRRLVVDPVRTAKGGASLLREEALDAMRSELLPLAEIITPNIPEACDLLGLHEEEINAVPDMVRAAEKLLSFGPRYVLLKGGHLNESGGEACDVLVGQEVAEPTILRVPRISTTHTHGTGCTIASAIAAYAARGSAIPEAVQLAKTFVTAAISHSAPTGSGIGTLWHAAHRMR